MMFTWICQKSIDFASTFLNQNSVIQRFRKSILYCKLQVIVTLLEANNQNARAVSHPPGCLWDVYQPANTTTCLILLTIPILTQLCRERLMEKFQLAFRGKFLWSARLAF